MITKELIAVTEFPEHLNRYGKPMTAYVARVTGLDEKWGLARSFLKSRVAGGYASLPDRDGVYEVRDWLAVGSPRKRYFQVLGGEAVEITMACPEDDDVLSAVDAGEQGGWYLVGVGGASADGRRPSAQMALEALDGAIETTRELSGEEGFDVEDVFMELDKVRRVLEAMVE